jgi:hypothetical protein
VRIPRCIGIILGARTVGNDKYLDVFIETARRPEAVAVISLYLVESFFDSNPSAL